MRGVRRVARCSCFVELWFAEISVMFSKVVAKVVIFFFLFFFFPYFAYQPSTYAPSRKNKKHLFFLPQDFIATSGEQRLIMRVIKM